MQNLKLKNQSKKKLRGMRKKFNKKMIFFCLSILFLLFLFFDFFRFKF